MKKWTVVIEIQDRQAPGQEFTRQEIESAVSEAMQAESQGYGFGFQIFETIEAPYGPQHPDGVFIADSGRHGNFRQ